MEQILTANNNDVDAVLSENDGMAGGVIAALQAQGLLIPVGGQDGDLAALNRVARGTQTVSVWKDARAARRRSRQHRGGAGRRHRDGRDRRCGEVVRRCEWR